MSRKSASLVRRIAEWFAVLSGRQPTEVASGSLAADLSGITAEVSPEDRTAAARGKLGIRTAAQDSTAVRPIRQASRAVTKAVGRGVKLADHVVGSSHAMASTTYRSAQVEIEKLHRSRDLYGVIGSWTSGAVYGAFLLLYAAFETPFLVSTFRVLFDVPASVGVFDLSDASNLTSVSLAGMLASALILTIGFSAKNAAHTFMPGRSQSGVPTDGVAPDSEESGVARAHSQVKNYIPRTVYWSIGLAILSGGVVVIHLLAEARFNAGLFSTDDSLPRAMAWVSAVAPLIGLLTGTVAGNPQYVWVRHVSRLGLRHRLFEIKSIRRERHLRRRGLLHE